MNTDTIKQLKKQLTKFSQMIAGKQSCESSTFVYSDINLENTFKDYENVKDDIKDILKNKDFLADRHKISAFFISSILKNKPIVIKENLTDLEDHELEFVINYNLAITFSKYIIRSFYYKIHQKTLNLKIPNSSSKNKTYEDQLIALVKMFKDTLDHNDDKKILLLAVSHILFLLEKYSESISNA